MILDLVAKKDPKVLATIKRVKGELTFSQMSGTGVYKCAKELWPTHGKQDGWGK